MDNLYCLRVVCSSPSLSAAFLKSKGYDIGVVTRDSITVKVSARTQSNAYTQLLNALRTR